MDSRKPEHRIDHQLLIAAKLTGIPARLLLAGIRWNEPFSPADNWSSQEGFTFPDLDRAQEVIRAIGDQGGDLLFIICTILWLVDGSKKYDFVVAGPAELKEESDSLPAARCLGRIMDEDVPLLERTFGSRNLEPLRREIQLLLENPQVRIVHLVSSSPKAPLRPREGRPLQYFWNMMMLLVSRHIEKTLPRPRSGGTTAGLW